jgi:hypothetical protein
MKTMFDPLPLPVVVPLVVPVVLPVVVGVSLVVVSADSTNSEDDDVVVGHSPPGLHWHWDGSATLVTHSTSGKAFVAQVKQGIHGASPDVPPLRNDPAEQSTMTPIVVSSTLPTLLLLPLTIDPPAVVAVQIPALLRW